jgi:hypothetical protein
MSELKFVAFGRSEISQAPPHLEASRALSSHLFFLEHCPMNVLEVQHK